MTQLLLRRSPRSNYVTNRRGRGPQALAAVALLAGGSAPAAPTSASSLDTDPQTPTVVLGVGGLRWSDVSAQTTPSLWGLVGRASVGSISVRTVRSVTCPLDAWLTVSTGQRAVGSPSATPLRCPPLPEVTGGRVSGWRSYLELQRAEVGSYGEPGLLGDRIARSGGCALAVGPGAAVALATSHGRVPRFAPTLDAADVGSCPLTVVDGGSLPPAGAARLRAVRAVDALVARLTSETSPGAALLLVGIADAAGAEPGLGLALAFDPASADRGWLTSNSTRRTGLVQLTDLTATALAAMDSPYVGVDGAPVVVTDGLPRRLDTAETVRDRLAFARLAESLPTMAPRLGVLYLALVVLPLAAVALGWWRRRRRGADPALPTGWRLLALVVVVAAGATPVSGYLPTLVSWWTTASPALSLLSAATAVIAVVTLLALVPPVRSLRREAWGPALVVSGVTFTVLTLDALAGTPLQVASPLVSGPVTGGRFYGFSNVTFAVYATSALLLAGALAQVVRSRFGVAAAAATVGGVGAVAVVIDGWPTLGADFGGILAMLPGFGYLGLVVAGRRVTLHGAAAVAVVTVAATAAISAFDWLRGPGQRSHFGGFVQKILDGQADDIVVGKAVAAVQTLANPFGVLALVVLAAGVAFVVRPDRFGTAQRTLWQAWPTLLPTLRAVAVVAVLGTLLNDSGVLVAGAMLATGLPLVIAAALRLPTTPPAPAEAAVASSRS